ncbi:MAG: RIP metalloprotease [Nitriliruptoraceae bacterium]
MSGAWSITAFVLAILLAIMLHEAGHFVTARRFGMRADRFFLGFGPTLWSIRRGETEYGVKALPLGGFVRIIGMLPDDERLPSAIDAAFDDLGHGEPDAQASVAGVDWAERLDTRLRERGTPADVSERIVRRMRGSATDPTDVEAMRRLFHEVVVTEVDDTGRVGDLRHRLLYGDRDRFFHERPAWQRAIVLVSGSVAHFLIAIAVLIGAYAFLPQWTGTMTTTVAEVAVDSPAADAGLQPGDRVVGVRQLRSDDYARLRDEIRAQPDRPIDVHVVRGDDELVLTMTPEATELASGEVIGVVGFAPEPEFERMRPVDAIERALVGQPELGSPGGFVPMVTGSLQALGTVFSPSGIGDILSQAAGQQERSLDGAVSLVGAASIAGQLGDTSTGLVLFLGLIAVVNVFIGIFNLVPLPPLDGGHLAALGIEGSVNQVRRLRGRSTDYRLDPRALSAVAVPVLAILAVIVLALLWLDITDPIRLG